MEKFHAGDVWGGFCPEGPLHKTSIIGFHQKEAKMKMNLKKAMYLGFVLVICAMFASTVMAGNETGIVPAPGDLAVEDPVNGEVCFSWTAVDGAVKYSVAIEVVIDDEVYEFDFGSNDYGPGLEEGTETFSMCIPLDEIVADLDGDGILEQLSGTATAKIKGLDPGKDKGRQNNVFSYPPVVFELPPVEVTVE